jgi:hypothetical protein
MLTQTAPFRGPKRGRPGACDAHRQAASVAARPWCACIDFGATPDWAPAHGSTGSAWRLALGGGDTVRLRWSVLDCEVGRAAQRAAFLTPVLVAQSAQQPATFVRADSQPDGQRECQRHADGADWVAMTETPHQLLLGDARASARSRALHGRASPRFAARASHRVGRYRHQRRE